MILADASDAIDDKANAPATESKPTQLPPVTVVGDATGKLAEEQPVGAYGQPEWTTHRRFAGTRLYVLQQGQIEAEFWTVARIKREGPSKVDNMIEIEFGLPYRFQWDFYMIARTEDGGDHTYGDQQVELRYALADWGKLWGNPTIYLEYRHQAGDEPDKVETKLLFGGEITTRWHWASNLVFEAEAGGEQEDEWAFTSGVSYSVFDKVLSVGAETELAIANTKGERSSYEKDLLLGPSVQWRPCNNLHVDFAPLFGLTHDSKAAKIYLNVGWEF
ncbi:MAG: transporter [Planctomycetes bacterium]|nr:transporter [Planctomycetota bacterium]